MNALINLLGALLVATSCFIASILIFSPLAIVELVFHFIQNQYIGWATVLIIVLVLVGARFGFGNLGSRLLHYVRKIEIAALSNKLKNDVRSPVIYLRSFTDDAVTSKSAEIWSYFYFPSIRTEEEQLASVLSGIGPVIAVGMPGEALPELGARRIYLNHETWQDGVGKLMGEAALVVIRPASTSGIWWEISYAMKTVKPERILIVITFDADQYKVFAQEFMRICGVELPQYDLKKHFPINAFIYFEPDGLPRLIKIKTNFILSVRSFTEHHVPYISSTLEPVLVRLNANWKRPKMSALPVIYPFILYIIGIIFGAYIGHMYPME